VLAAQQALDHVGPVQAVDAVDSHYAVLPLLVTWQGSRLEEALAVEVLLDGVPQPGQTADTHRHLVTWLQLTTSYHGKFLRSLFHTVCTGSCRTAVGAICYAQTVSCHGECTLQLSICMSKSEHELAKHVHEQE